MPYASILSDRQIIRFDRVQYGLEKVNTDEIQARLDDFAKERDWEQFHSPKNLSMALAGEVGELLEIFQWLTEEQSQQSSLTEDQLAAATEELADVLIYALRLAETEQLPTDLKRRLVSRVRSVIPAVVSHDAQEWESYVITPLRVAPSPRSSVADLLRQDVQAHLDYVIEHQGEDGSWAPTWTWGDAFPEAWQDAEREWRGRLTVQALRVLRNFDRLE